MLDMSEADDVRDRTLYILLCSASMYLLQVYESLLRYAAHKYGYGTDFIIYENGKEAVFCKDDWYQELDILFIGWESCQIRGIEIARVFRKDYHQSQIFFLGSHAQEVLASFEVNPYYYFIESEVTHKKFELIMRKCFQEIMESKKNSLRYTNNGKIQRVLFDLIVYLKVDHRLISIQCRDKTKILFYESLKSVEEKMNDEMFMKVHRGYIVNLNYVDCLDKNDLYLTSGDVIPVARKYKQMLVERMMK